MQQLNAPTAMELNFLQGYQMLGQVRIQQTILHDATMRCIDKCMDTDDLFTLHRNGLPITQRLKADEKERTCVKNCSAKWDELFRREGQRLMRASQDEKNWELMMKMQSEMAQMSGGGGGGH